MNNDIRPVDMLLLKFDCENSWVECPFVELMSGTVDAESLHDDKIIITNEGDTKEFTKTKFREFLIKEFKYVGVVTHFVIQPAGIPETLDVVNFKNKYSK